MQVISFKIFLEKNNRTVRNRLICKIINEQVDAHSRRHSKNGCEAKSHNIFAVEQKFFRISFRSAVKRNRMERRFLRAVNFAGRRAIPAVSCRINDDLIFAAKFVYHFYRVEINGLCGKRVALARRKTDNRGKRYYYISIFQQIFYNLFVSAITVNKIKIFIVAAFKQSILSEKKIV